MLDGTAKKYGGNVQRAAFGAKAAGSKDRTDTKIKTPPGDSLKGEGDSSTTTITHNPDGTHTVKHADGEESMHPSIGHLSMALSGKHDGGNAMHVQDKDGSFATHHVGMDGAVEGPNEHGSADEAAEHMKQTLGMDGENASMQESGMSDPHPGGMDLY